jgi:acyl-CoA thioesterase-1
MRSPGAFVLLAALAFASACQSGPSPNRANKIFEAVAPALAELQPVASAAVVITADSARPTRIRPNPLISRGRPVTASARFDPPATSVVDGQYKTFAGTWSVGRLAPGKTAWVAIDVNVGPERLIVVWSASGSYNYNETNFGSPGSYRVETSADSTNGGNGTWRPVVHADYVSAHAAEHAFDFDGQRWVRFVVISAPAVSPNGVQIDEIDLHDASTSEDDTWFFMGDSITAFAFDRQTPVHQPSFAERVHTQHPDYFPAMINGGVGGDKSDEGLEHLDAWLAGSPDVKHWALGYGTNDAAGNAQDPSHFKQNLQAMVTRIRGAGRVPSIAKIPFASDHQHDHVSVFNDVIDEVNAANSLVPGPDLYRWFWAHPEELRDGVHPNDRGIQSINRLWADAMAPFYPP